MSSMVENAGSEASRKTALIVEGGAMRGAWAAGVLAFLQERGRRQYDFVYAASSGACSAAYFVADMWEPGLVIWRELASRVVRKTNFLRRKPIIDLAYLVDHVMRTRVPLSVEALQRAPTKFFIVLTDCHTGEPVYFHVFDDRVFAALRATSSMPLATRGFDYVDGQPYADGGVSDPIPLRRAIQDGATDITVVLTHNPAFRLKPVSRWMGRFAFPDFPAVARVWTAQQNVYYNAALDLMKQPPAGVRIRVFRPMRQMPVGSFSVEPKQIAAALALGHDEAVEQMEVMEGKPVAVRVSG
ncbi:MAG TPA: patatin family protein [Candidatus Acidoferrales bacterium]|jgi:predicted patatin/cPLA2 family phospholipase|nr:patatin family protein [Candidatus Acidoferrales bacterium]